MDENEIKQKNDKFTVVATKVAPDFAIRFKRLCNSKGLKPYQALQMMMDTFVRYTDDRHNLTQPIEQAMSIFEHMVGWRDAFTLAEADTEKDIEEAVYFLSAKGRKGVRAIMVQRPFFGNWNETANTQLIMERMMEALSPERYARLRQLAIDEDCSSILELIDKLIDRASKDVDVSHFRQEFEDAQRSEFGKQPTEHRYVRHHRKDPDLFDQAEKRRKEREEKAKEASQWLEENSDFRPFGSEW